jgi:peptidoglycan/LPS O-acetylase OafA/YrhL
MTKIQAPDSSALEATVIRFSRKQDGKSFERDHSIDFLRAAAIVSVVVYHIAGEWPIASSELRRLVGLGKHGVLLFFLISGWLIGGLIFRELRASGRLDIPKFWYRRWARTVPPYFAALGINYAAVFLDRNQHFDYSYLFFLQNYRDSLPFFGVSWSLCVEEHFYLFLPLVLTTVLFLGLRWVVVALVFASILPSLLRCVDPLASPYGAFGYSFTATHLVFEGLTFGVAASFVFIYQKRLWDKLQSVCRLVWPFAVAAFLSTAYWEREINFYLGPLCITFAFLIVLCAFAARKSLLGVRYASVFWVAQISYSMYLTHFLAIHLGKRLIGTSDSSNFQNVFAFLTWVILITISAVLFWFFVERQSIRIRDLLQGKLFVMSKDHSVK